MSALIARAAHWADPLHKWWEGAKAVVFVCLVVAVCSLAYCTMQRAKKTADELQDLRAFRASVEAGKVFTKGETTAFDKATAGATAERAAQATVFYIHDQATKDAANEDPASADFLRAPIPRRLRDADARARATGRLESGGRPRR